MTYTINGVEHTEFDINEQCAELLGVHVAVKGTVHDMYLDKEQDEEYNPCNNPSDTWPIIEKCFNELMLPPYEHSAPSMWESIIDKHNCTKLIAACICYIEIKEDKL